jgi:hypothetical protein
MSQIRPNPANTNPNPINAQSCLFIAYDLIVFVIPNTAQLVETCAYLVHLEAYECSQYAHCYPFARFVECFHSVCFVMKK